MEYGNINPNLEIGGEIEEEIPEIETSEIDIVNELKQGKYSEVPIEDLEWAYEKALHIYLSRVFPYQHDIVEIPDDRPRDKIWVKRCMIEILAMNNIVGDMPLTAYKENGISFTFSENSLSSGLMNDLPPPVVGFRGRRR